MDRDTVVAIMAAILYQHAPPGASMATATVEERATRAADAAAAVYKATLRRMSYEAV